MVLDRMKLAVPALLLFLPNVIFAKLQMHVFEENSAVVQPGVIESPNIQMYVFPNMAGVHPAYPVLRQHQRPPTPEKTPFLAYDRAEFYVRTGYRRDELSWNKAGLNGTPNILSELEWKNIEIAEIKFGTTLFTKDNWVFNLDASYGRIIDGENQDSDYLGNNRTLEFSRSNNGADEGDVYDLSVSAGYRYQWQHEMESTTMHSELRPLIGVSYHAQNLKIVDGFQTIPALGPFSGLDSSYDTTWFGPWVGFDGFLDVNPALSFKFGMEYHYAFYDATANWNLRTDFAHPESFTHEAEGYGFITELEGQYKINSNFRFNIALNYQDWQADKDGEDHIFFADNTEVTLKLNEVKWRSFSASLGLIYEF